MLRDLWSGLAQGSSSCQYAEWVIARVAGQRSSRRCRLVLGGVLQHGLGEAGQLGGSQGVAASVKERVAVLLLRGLACSEGSRSSDLGHAQRVNCWVTAGVEQVVEACGGLVDQWGHAVGVLWVTFEVGVRWGGTRGGTVAISCPQVILQTFHIFRVADPQQLSLLLSTQEGLQDGGIVVKASVALQGQRQHGGEDRGWHLGWSWSRSWFRLWGSSLGDERKDAVGVEVRVAQPDSSRLDGSGHHHCSLWLTGGLSDALWIIRISTSLVDFTEVLEVVVEGRALF